jgi:hypothetical protein
LGHVIGERQKVSFITASALMKGKDAAAVRTSDKHANGRAAFFALSSGTAATNMAQSEGARVIHGAGSAQG